MFWIFLIAICVVLPITTNLINLPQRRKALQIKEIEALIELERVKQENYLLENAEMRQELESIREENQKYLNNTTKNSKWLIEETKIENDKET